MCVKYKGYTLEMIFTSKDYLVPTKVIELNMKFNDIANAKRYIDSL